MQKILVTGGAGFVGRHLIKRLLDRGDQVICVDPIWSGSGGVDPEAGWPLFQPLDHRNFVFVREDCRDYFKRVSDTDFDYAFHLAAVVGGRLVIENDPLAVAIDLSIDAEYWRWAALTKPKKNVCFSSSAAYPIRLQREDHFVLLREDMIDFNSDVGMPDLSYGWAKLTNELLAKLAFERYGLLSAIYRPFSGYGEDQDMTYPFPSICKRILDNLNQPIVKVWGTGRQMRDFIHIEDCIDGILLTVDRLNKAEPINLSTGAFTSFIELAKTAARIAGYNPDVQGMSDKPEGVFARGGDTTKQREFDFGPKISLQAGIERAFDYFLKGQRPKV